MNNISLIGNLTKDIELRSSTTTEVAKFSLAVRRDKDNTDFINCVAFGKTAELLSQYTSKGNKLAVEGRLQTGSYDNKDGVKIYTTEVIVNKMHLLEKKSDTPVGNPQQDFKPTYKEVPKEDPYSFMADGLDEDID